MPTREQIVARARTYLGVRWQHQGRTRRGMDCGGIVKCTADDLGIPFADCFGYSRLPAGDRLKQILRERMDEIALSELQPGDVIVMGADAGYPCHIGLITSIPGQGLGLLHSSARLTERKVVEHRLSEDWREKIQGCFRFRGLS